MLVHIRTIMVDHRLRSVVQVVIGMARVSPCHRYLTLVPHHNLHLVLITVIDMLCFVHLYCFNCCFFPEAIKGAPTAHKVKLSNFLFVRQGDLYATLSKQFHLETPIVICFLEYISLVTYPNNFNCDRNRHFYDKTGCRREVLSVFDP